MRAIVNNKYGGPEVLEEKNLEKPQIAKDEILVKTHASSINSWDWDYLRGSPKIYRLLFGIFKPKHNVLGADIAGVIEEIGDEVKDYKKGDRVFGDASSDHWGGFAEYSILNPKRSAIIPSDMSFQTAAALPQGAILALQSIKSFDSELKGKKVLINGAAGSVGPFAIQLAKNGGAEVWACDSGEKKEFLKEVGSDHFIDYTKEDFTALDTRFDFVIDLMLSKRIKAALNSLNPYGNYLIVGGSVSAMIGLATLGNIMASRQKKKVKILAHKPDNEELKEILDLIDSGKLKVFVDSSFPLSSLRKAFEYVSKASFKGKVIIDVVGGEKEK